jgi:hypothetical protein
MQRREQQRIGRLLLVEGARLGGNEQPTVEVRRPRARGLLDDRLVEARERRATGVIVLANTNGAPLGSIAKQVLDLLLTTP